MLCKFFTKVYKFLGSNLYNCYVCYAGSVYILCTALEEKELKHLDGTILACTLMIMGSIFYLCHVIENKK